MYVLMDRCLNFSVARKVANEHNWPSDTGRGVSAAALQNLRNRSWLLLYVRIVDGARPFVKYR